MFGKIFICFLGLIAASSAVPLLGLLGGGGGGGLLGGDLLGGGLLGGDALGGALSAVGRVANGVVGGVAGAANGLVNGALGGLDIFGNNRAPTYVINGATRPVDTREYRYVYDNVPSQVKYAPY